MKRYYSVLMTEEEMRVFSSAYKKASALKKAAAAQEFEQELKKKVKDAILKQKEKALKVGIFSDSDDALGTAGKVGMGLGAAAGLTAGGAYLAQRSGVKNVMKTLGYDPSHNKEIFNNFMTATNKGYKDIGLGGATKRQTADLYGFYKDTVGTSKRAAKRAAKSTMNAAHASKIKRVAGRGALIAGGLGALAYGASKIAKDDR